MLGYGGMFRLPISTRPLRLNLKDLSASGESFKLNEIIPVGGHTQFKFRVVAQ